MREVMGPPPLEAEAKPAEGKKIRKKTGAPKPRKRGRKRRRLFWGGLAVAVFGAAAAIAFNWDDVRKQADALRLAVVEHPEFAVTEMEVSGHRHLSVHDIGALVGLDPEDGAVSSLRFDARAARDALLANPWIERASVAVDPSGMMRINIGERLPVAIWRNDEGYALVDEGGTRIVPVEGPEARLDLPLLIGAEAGRAVGDALALLRAAPPSVLNEVSALVRRGGRRWDVISSRGIVIKLPEGDALGALREYADRRIGERTAPFAVQAVDLRLRGEPPVIRLEPGASEMRDDLLRTLRTTYE
jgi:cell division protein FtsQ